MPGLSENRNIVLGVTGSIAAYKAPELARLLVSRGYAVRCVMTKSAKEFIGPLTLQSVTNQPVMSDFWEGAESTNIEHIELADWANVVVVAPATADIIAKMANGFAESPLLATLLATKAPILLAPAMNVNMFEHAATQQNIKTLHARGVHFVDPEEGALACGWNGTGRLADPNQIFYHIRRLVSKGDFKGKRVLITTGPTREAIDPVRFVSNRSSGKMGVALAQEAFCRGAEVTLIHGAVPVKVPDTVKCVPVVTAEEMHQAVVENGFKSENAPDVIIMAAAVSDFRPSSVAKAKIKKDKFDASIKLTETVDILMEAGKIRKNATRPVLVGFAVETGEIEDLISEASEKMKRKGIDLIVGNFASDAFDLDTNRVWMIDKTGRQEEVATTFKSRVANRILDAILRL